MDNLRENLVNSQRLFEGKAINLHIDTVALPAGV